MKKIDIYQKYDYTYHDFSDYYNNYNFDNYFYFDRSYDQNNNMDIELIFIK